MNAARERARACLRTGMCSGGALARDVLALADALDAHREAAKAARFAAAAPDYDEEAIRGALWALVDLVLAADVDRRNRPEGE